MNRNFCRLLLILMLFAAASSVLRATGALYVRPLGTQQLLELMSIKTYDATVNIQDQVAVTHVDQVFHNSTSSRVEATFIFPLPEGAVITELIYWFNGKRYVASLRERQEAQKAYTERVRERIDPALLQYLGANLFKLNIAPIDPNSDVRFEITYAELLTYEFGAVTYRFPLRTTGLSPSSLDRVSVSIDATTSRSFKSFTSPSHGNGTANGIHQIADNHYTVTFGDEHFLPDRDLTLRWETRRDNIDLQALTYRPTPADSFGMNGFYALWITPPDSTSLSPLPRNVVFTADISSSMEGTRITQLKEALTAFLDALNPNDRFNIVVFSTNAVAFRTDLVAVTPGALDSARTFVDGLGAIGLTNIDGALRLSLGMSFDPDATSVVVFLTDGYPTWGEQNLTAIADSAAARNGGRVRIFPFGIGDEISKELLGNIALRNGGYPTYITSDDSIAATVANYFKRVSSPVLSDLRLDYGGLATYDRYPTVLGNLFWGNQVLQFGRYTNSGTFTITANATRLKEPFAISNTITFGADPGGNRAVARLWAKYKIDYLLEQIQLYGEKKELVDAVVDLSIHYGILTPYTALYSDPTVDPSSGVDNESVLPTTIAFDRVSPNPFSDQARITFYLPPQARGAATVTIHDALGRPVRTLLDRTLGPGRHEVVWDGTDDDGTPLAAGTYFCRVETSGQQASTTLILVR